MGSWPAYQGLREERTEGLRWWPMNRRRLPNGYLVKRLRTIPFGRFLKAVGNHEKDGKDMDLKKLLVDLSFGAL